MDLLKDLKMSVINFNFVKIYIVDKILVLFKNNFNPNQTVCGGKARQNVPPPPPPTPSPWYILLYNLSKFNET